MDVPKAPWRAAVWRRLCPRRYFKAAASRRSPRCFAHFHVQRRAGRGAIVAPTSAFEVCGTSSNPEPKGRRPSLRFEASAREEPGTTKSGVALRNAFTPRLSIFGIIWISLSPHEPREVAMRFRKTLTFLILATALVFALPAWAQQKCVGPSGAGPRPNAVRPYAGWRRPVLQGLRLFSPDA